MIFGNCLGMAIFLAVAVWGGLHWMDRYTLHGVGVEMPDLKGQSASAALLKLEELGLKGEIVDTGYLESLRGNVIIEQSIKPGDKVKPGRWIELTVNATEARKVALPSDIAGNCSLREAEMRLQALGFTIGEPEYILGDKNWVYEMKVNGRVVPGGAKVSVKAPIVLVVGDGQVEEEYSGGDFFNEEAFGDSAVIPDDMGDKQGGSDDFFE